MKFMHIKLLIDHACSHSHLPALLLKTISIYMEEDYIQYAIARLENKTENETETGTESGKRCPQDR